ncbi:hypothetical protein S58_69130 [Bradyrhizobium oligotrophicum S58]|uniref:Ig-like domain-containing protein n=1 Tax=Bradyrhizobium oligotrophicum S58 TaxID=1245469 RepID=M4ZGJ2_9BRAD|nr:hypothetical protein [Bradyrhizobium oligotrophicum]BAM92879.1 hypothetical protein S58_69130 [Bradyrhizobium oligotrophicum S58]
MQAYAMRTLALIGFFALPLAAQEAAAENCELKIVMATYERTSSYHSDYRLAKFVKEEDWNELSKNAGASGKIYGVPVSGSYGEFKKAYNAMEQQLSESLSQDQAQQIFWTGLDKSAADAYQKCLELNVFNQLGLHIAVVEGSEDAVLLKVRWTFPGANTAIKIKWTVPTVNGEPLPTEIDPGDNFVSVARPKTGGIIVAATYNGVASEVIKIASLPPPPPIKIENCVLQPSADVCLRCEFEVNDVVTKGANSKEYACRKMPGGALISVQPLDVKISRAAGTGDCWYDVQMKGPDEKPFSVLNYSGECLDPMSASGSSKFVKPVVNGLGKASFFVEKCGSGSICRIQGKLVIEAETSAK